MISEIADAEISDTVSVTENTETKNTVTENTVTEIETEAVAGISDTSVSADDSAFPEKHNSGSDRDLEEISRLRDELARERETFSRLAEGYEELSELYPGADLRSMPDSFRENVRRGVPPAAAYALEIRRREVDAARAAEAERLARENSAGGLRGADSSLLSPDEVRAMSRDEVRSNFSRILESMKSW